MRLYRESVHHVSLASKIVSSGYTRTQLEFLSRLKSQTRAEHDRIEAVLGLMDGTVDRLKYRDRLLCFRAFYAPLEATLDAANDWGVWGIDLAPRRKTHLIDRDLRDLGVDDPGSLSWCSADALPALDSPAGRFGCLYVLEGATLGGQVILRHLERALGLDACHGARFFNGYGEHTGAMWKSFRSALASFAVSPSRQDEVVASAVDTFIKMREACVAAGKKEPDRAIDARIAGAV